MSQRELEPDTEVVTRLVIDHGREAVSPAVLSPSIRRMLTHDGVVGFVDVAGTRVFAGSAIGDGSARSHPPDARAMPRRRVVFGRELSDEAPVPSGAYVVGEEPWWELSAWDETVRGGRSLRAQIRRAAHKGVRLRRCTSSELAPGTSLRAELERLIESWLGTRHLAPLGFVATVAPLATLEHRRVLVAELDQRVVGAAFAIPIGGRRAWLVDHVVRSPDAPNGTAEALVDATFRDLANTGATTATLGLCPLAGRVPAPLTWVLRLSRGLFDFRGLSTFKAKLRPQHWERVLLEHPGQSALLGTVRALRAFAGGSFARFGVQTALRGPPPLLRAVALLLVPWCVLLAQPGAAAFFPAPWQRWGWIAFDLLLLGALLWLAARVSRRHRRRWLHRVLAVFVTADAAVTLTQAVLWNAPRARSGLDWTLIVVACAAPSLVAPVLWSALRFRER